MADEATRRRRDAAATREALLAAAVQEFAIAGLAGARIDRIAERAGVNKRMIYAYFGNKEELFDAVVSRHAEQLGDAVPITVEDLGAYAGAVFDHLVENPDTLRLVAWRDFEREAATGAERQAYAAKLTEIRAAQRAGILTADIEAVDLLALVQQMAVSWLRAPIGLLAAAGKNPMSRRRLARHREALVEAVRRVSDPRA